MISKGVLEMYVLFGYELLQILSFGISKMRKEWLFSYVSSGGAVKSGRKAVLWGLASCYLQLKGKEARRHSWLILQKRKCLQTFTDCIQTMEAGRCLKVDF